MSVLALIPARSGSKGIPGKNWRQLPDGTTPVGLAAARAIEAGIVPWVNCTVLAARQFGLPHGSRHWPRPLDLDADDTPMLAVVQEMLAGGWAPNEDDIILLLQPTAVFRTASHLRQAIRLLQESGADSVVSVVELPQSHSPELLCWIGGLSGYLCPFDVKRGLLGGEPRGWASVHTRRQDTRTGWYRRDGTVYAFRRSTVSDHGNIYGADVRPLIIPPEQSCELDTEADWENVVRRWEAQHGR